MCESVHAHRYLRVDIAACYVTESGQAVDISSHQVDEALKSILFSPQTFILSGATNTQAQYGDTHSHSKSSLTLPMVLHDRLQAVLMNTHTKPNKTHFNAHTHTYTLTQDGAYLPSPVSVLHFPKELLLKTRSRRGDLIILDISGAEQVSFIITPSV